MFESLKSYLNVLTTRSGAETLVGIKPNKVMRSLRMKALKDFRDKHSDFEIIYDRAGTANDYDGYVQYFDNDNNKICWLAEREFRVKKLWYELSSPETKNKKRGYTYVLFEILDGEKIPEIKDLLAEVTESEKDLRDQVYIGMNIVMARAYLENLFLDENKAAERKAIIKIALTNMINNQRLPFQSFEQIAKSSSYTQLLAISQFLYDIKVSKPEDPFEFYKVNDSIFDTYKINPFFDPEIRRYGESLSSIQTAQKLHVDRCKHWVDITKEPLDLEYW
jgi:hypothetical protein